MCTCTLTAKKKGCPPFSDALMGNICSRAHFRNFQIQPYRSGIFVPCQYVSCTFFGETIQYLCIDVPFFNIYTYFQPFFPHAASGKAPGGPAIPAAQPSRRTGRLRPGRRHFSGPRQGRPAQRTPGTHRMVNFRVNESVGALTGAGAPGKIGASDTNRG